MLAFSMTLPDIATEPAKEGLAAAAPILIVTLMIAVVGGGFAYTLGRHRRRIARFVVSVLSTILVALGLILAIFYVYLPVFWE